jgi:prepilin-type N-terminal cleavage/methylation domain-containing protein/prepilin-type processing-associated H-X9-DG protein
MVLVDRCESVPAERTIAPMLSSRRRLGRPVRGGFTLVELLVVVGIVATLIAILLPALTKARESAMQVKTASDLRQVMIGYTSYHLNHRGAVLFGYPPNRVNGVQNVVTDPVSGITFYDTVGQRYPWRLVNYVAGIWEILYPHKPLPDRPLATDAFADAEYKAYVLALNPSFGINAVFVGGQVNASYAPWNCFTGPDSMHLSPNTGKHCVFRASEVRRTTDLIVFAECQAWNSPGVVNGDGMSHLTPPRGAGKQRWTVLNNVIVPTQAHAMGLPVGRFGKETTVGFFDGHVSRMTPRDLEDMRYWSVRADRPDWDY